jgi:sugar O-acyltransferase (sialic acid O-acetyltransferase NeuD family)
MEPIVLVGGGGHCLSCIDVVEKTGQYHIIGILDVPEKVGQKILDYSIIGTDGDIEYFSKQHQNFLITVGQISSTKIREKIYTTILNFGGKLPVIISPMAYVSKYSKIGIGSIIMHHALINVSSSIGACAIVNTKALVEHEAMIGDFCHISTGSVINGQVNIGNRCFIGSNAVLANNISITSDSIISAGSQVFKNIANAGTYIGNPIRRIH